MSARVAVAALIVWLGGSHAAAQEAPVGPDAGVPTDDAGAPDAGALETETGELPGAPDAGLPAPDGGATTPGDAGTEPAGDAGAAQPPPPKPEPRPERPAPEPRPGPGTRPTEPTFIPVPVPTVEPDLVEELFPVLPEGGPWTTAGLLFLLLTAVLASAGVRRIRDGLPDTGLLPRILDVVHTVVRIAIFVIALGIVAYVIPRSLGPGLSWALLAAAAAVGWSARDVLPDVIAGVVLLFERRIRPGVWVSAADHSGIVESRGLRAVWLRDGLGHRIALPNRLLLTNAVVSQPGGAYHDVSVRFEARVPAAKLRQALRDAVLTSPWVQPESAGMVRRDGMDPSLWHVRARLIDVRFAVSFEGDFLERAEEMLEEEHSRMEEDWD